MQRIFGNKINNEMQADKEHTTMTVSRQNRNMFHHFLQKNLTSSFFSAACNQQHRLNNCGINQPISQNRFIQRQ